MIVGRALGPCPRRAERTRFESRAHWNSKKYLYKSKPLQMYNATWHHTGLQVWPQFHHEMDLQNLVFLPLHGVLPISLLTHRKFVTAQFIETIVWVRQWWLYKQRSLWMSGYCSILFFIYTIHTDFQQYYPSNLYTIYSILILLLYSYLYCPLCEILFTTAKWHSLVR